MVGNDFGGMIHKINDITAINTTPSDSLILNALLVCLMVILMLTSIYKLRGGNFLQGLGLSAVAVASMMSVLALPFGIYLILKIFGGSVDQ